MYKWNRIYSFIMELKALYIKEHGTENMFDLDGYDSIISKWAENVSDNSYADILKFVQVNQYGDMCLLKYKSYNSIFGQIEYEDFWEVHDQFYRYCRGVTVDVRNDKLVLCAFDKFFNINELPETSTENVQKKIEAGSVIEITNKMDGSLQMARYYDGNIVLSGSTSLNPQESFRVANGISFISEHPEYVKMLMENPSICFIFESIMPDDPHVVYYDYENSKGLYLIGARNIETGEVYDYDQLRQIIDKYDPMHTEQEPISFDEMLNMRKDFRCNEKEGWVVNIDGWRVKVKCDDFITFHGLFSGVRKNSDRLGSSLLDAMKADRLDDFISSLPPGKYHDDAIETLKTITDYLAYCNEQTELFYSDGAKLFDNPKDFMSWVDKNIPKQFQGPVRNKYRGKSTDFLKGKKFKDIVEAMKNVGV